MDSEGRLSQMQMGIDWLPIAVLISAICLAGWAFAVAGHMMHKDIPIERTLK